MTAIVKQNLRQAVATALVDDIRSGIARYYYYLGGTAEVSGSAVLGSPEYETKTRSEIVLLKSVPTSNVSLVIPRRTWVTGTIIAQYDIKIDPISISWYCTVPDIFNVYKCLDNNGGAQSTVVPTGTDINPFITADGYKWKFMFNIPLALRNKFMTNEYIPVATALQGTYFSNGSVESIEILSPGSGYVGPSTVINVSGDGAGASFTPIISNGQLVGISIDNPGSGYSFINLKVNCVGATLATVAVYMSSGDVNTPTAITEMLSVPGSIDNIYIVNGGTGYTTAAVSIVGNGFGATATATIVSGIITKINITAPGSGYSYATVSITGNGANANVYANISPPLGHGRNSPKELGATAVMIVGSLTQEAYGGIPIVNDYRQYGIIKDPRNLSFGTNVNNPVGKKRYAIIGTFSEADFPVGASVVNTSGDVFVIVSAHFSGASPNQKKGLVLEFAVAPVLTPMAGQTLQLSGFPLKTIYIAESTYNDIAVSAIGSTCYAVTATYDPVIFPLNTMLTKDGFRYRIISATSTKLLILPVNGGKMVVGGIYTKEGDVPYITATKVIPPNININTGELLYIDNRTAFNKADDQTITFKSVIVF